MKKLFLTSAIIALAIYPSYSTTVTGTGSECTEETLNTDTGPATLQAQWTANTITLEWYNDNEKITPNNSTANTCRYDGDVILPTNNPTKEGYTFGGWQVRVASAPQQTSFDLSTLNASTDGLYSASHGSTDYCYYNDGTDDGLEGDCSYSHISGLSAGQWETGFSYGSIRGIAKCSAKSGNNNGYTWNNASSNWTATESELNSASGEAKYCWCQPTSFAENGSSNYSPVASPSWVFNDGDGNAGSCAYYCTAYCATSTRIDSGFRAALFGISQ